MNPSLASIICACGIAGLVYLNRDNSVRTSKALWLPVAWISIMGSRPVSEWLGINPSGANVQLDGSPVDAAIFGALLAAAIVVLISRGRRTRAFVAANWPILVYFFYCLISVAWSYHPDVSFKRWIKAIGDPAMILIIATDGQPVAAFRRLISRVGFLLLPTSVLLIKYYDALGRGYTPDGAPDEHWRNKKQEQPWPHRIRFVAGSLRRIVALAASQTSGDTELDRTAIGSPKCHTSSVLASRS